MRQRRRVLLVILLCLALAGCNNSWSSGDRVLVSKFIYETDLAKPRRHDVVVFKYPEDPVKKGVPTNYIKRLLGLAGETLAIFFGQLFTYEGPDLQYPRDLDPGQPDATKADKLTLWQPEFMYKDNSKSLKLFREGKSTIIRKEPETSMALRRLVYDNDHQAKDLEGVLPPRWAPEDKNAWAANQPHGFQAAGGGKGQEVAWLRYRHILRPDDWPAGKDRAHKPQLITDFSGYNSYDLDGNRRRGPFDSPYNNWVGSLMLETELTVDKNQGELWLELAKGVDRFQARWDLATGKVTLVRLQDDGGTVKETILDSKETRISQPGTYQVRFADFDDQLTVWVDGNLPFEKGVAYEHAWRYDPLQGKFVNTGPTANDLKPASIGSKGAAVQVHHLKLWRDTYYTNSPGNACNAHLPSREEVQRSESPAKFWAEFWGDPSQWAPLRDLSPVTMYVQPGHYLCLGDNSPESSDSRTWGTVPDRLMLGRALVVYFPFQRMGPIH